VTRSSRGLVDVLDLAAGAGFALVLLDPEVDTTSPAGRFMVGVLCEVAALERELIRERTRAALAAKRQRGERQGPGPQLDPALRGWIVAEVEAGRSKKSLARELNERGVSTATGRGRWYPSTILAVCGSVAYERELTAAARGRTSEAAMRYYALVDLPEFPVERPLSLLRRPGPSRPLESLGRDGRWWSDSRPGLVSGEDLRELVELTAEQAAALIPLWTAGPR
jgi:hypothetical protein